MSKSTSGSESTTESKSTNDSKFPIVDPKCPECGEQVLYVEKSYNYHKIDQINENCVDLNHLDESISDEDSYPYIFCANCILWFDLKMNPLAHDKVGVSETS